MRKVKENKTKSQLLQEIVDMRQRVAELEGVEIEHRRVIEAIKIANAELCQVFDAAADGMRIIDKKFNIRRVNRAFLALAGLSSDETIGKKCYQIFRDPRCHTTRCSLTRIFNGEVRIECEVEKEFPNGTKIPCIITATPYRQHDGELFGIVEDIKDITELNRTQEQLREYRLHLEQLVENRTAELIVAKEQLEVEVIKRRRMEESLEELYQMEKKLRRELEAQIEHMVIFTRVLIHELKTPLTPMLGASDILVDILKDEELLRIARNINRGAHNLNNRINDLMDLAKGEIGILELGCSTVDMLQILHEVVDYVSPEVERREQLLSLQVPDSLPVVWADEDRIRQVILNLIMNSIRFTPAGGKITLTASAVDAKLIIEVKDTGCGIAENDQLWLFEPFHKPRMQVAKPSGLGLGLPLSKILVQLHGGQIWSKSKNGKGSTFAFSIPLDAGV